jgi:hypothetical protein
MVIIALSAVLAPFAVSSAGGASPATWKPYVRAEMVGGYVPYEYNLTALPTTLLVGDRVYRPGAMMTIYPGPALSAIEERIVGITSARNRTLELYAVTKTPKGGWGQPRVADAPALSLTVTANGSTRKVNVPAFGLDDPAMTKEQRAARARLNVALSALDALRGKSRMFRPVSVEAWVLPAELYRDYLMNEYPSQPLPWPAGFDSTEGCHLIPTAKLPPEINASSRFYTEDPSNSFAAVFRPVLPGELGCNRRR